MPSPRSPSGPKDVPPQIGQAARRTVGTVAEVGSVMEGEDAGRSNIVLWTLPRLRLVDPVIPKASRQIRVFGDPIAQGRLARECVLSDVLGEHDVAYPAGLPRFNQPRRRSVVVKSRVILVITALGQKPD